MDKDHQALREAVAKEYGFALYRQYAEKEVAGFLGKEISTMKRWRAKKLIPYIKMGPKHIRYFGYHIADMLLLGVDEGESDWEDTPDESSKLESGGSANGKAAKPTTAPATTPKHNAQSALALARATIQKPRKP